MSDCRRSIPFPVSKIVENNISFRFSEIIVSLMNDLIHRQTKSFI